MAPAGQPRPFSVVVTYFSQSECIYYLNVIDGGNRSAENIKVFENFFDLFYQIKEKKFQALRVKTLTFSAPRFFGNYDV
jgi:hypothetical protein